MAALHLVALALGFGACWQRANALRQASTTAHLGAVLRADNWYGIATLIWIVTGLWRAFGGLAKGTDYYLQSHTFWIKMALFGVIFLLELYPMTLLIKWRMALRRQKPVDMSPTPLMARLSYAELAGILAMVVVATAMARGM